MLVVIAPQAYHKLMRYQREIYEKGEKKRKALAASQLRAHDDVMAEETPGDRIAALMRAANAISHPQYATMVGVKHDTVGRWLRNENLPEPASYANMAARHGATVVSMKAHVEHGGPLVPDPALDLPATRGEAKAHTCELMTDFYDQCRRLGLDAGDAFAAAITAHTDRLARDGPRAARKATGDVAERGEKASQG